MQVINTPEGIDRFQMYIQLMAIKLELAGMKHSRGSVTAAVKRKYGLKGSRQSVYTQLLALYHEKYGTSMPERIVR